MAQLPSWPDVADVNANTAPPPPPDCTSLDPPTTRPDTPFNPAMPLDPRDPIWPLSSPVDGGAAPPVAAPATVVDVVAGADVEVEVDEGLEVELLFGDVVDVVEPPTVTVGESTGGSAGPSSAGPRSWGTAGSVTAVTSSTCTGGPNATSSDANVAASNAARSSTVTTSSPVSAFKYDGTGKPLTSQPARRGILQGALR